MEPYTQSLPLDENIKIPVYFDNPDEKEDDEMQRPFKGVMHDFENFVDTIKRLTNSMLKFNFTPKVCKEILDNYYYEAYRTTAPNPNDNYYYVLTTPELKDVENALEMLEFKHNMDVAKERKHVDELKKELWLLLPDFYKGHANPFPKPLTYSPEKPYPVLYVFNSFSEERRMRHVHKTPQPLNNPMKKDLTFPKTDAISQINIDSGFTITSGQTMMEVSLWGVNSAHSFEGLVCFVENVILSRHPAYCEIDEEGPEVYFYAEPALRKEDVRLIVSDMWEDWNNRKRFLKGVFNRQQLAKGLVNVLEHNWEYTEGNPYEIRSFTERLKEMI